MRHLVRGPLVLLLPLAAAPFIGCGSFVNFQTAHSLPQGVVSGDTVLAAAADGYAFDVRGRAGLGQGLEAGVSVGYSGLLAADLKFQFANQTARPSHPTTHGGKQVDKNDVPGNAPVCAAVDAGAGIGGFSTFYYGQVILSRKLNPWVEPYVAYRFQYIHLNVDLGDPDEVDDANGTILDDVINDAHDNNLVIHHFFFGAEFDFPGGFYVAAEGSVLAGEAEGFGDAGIAVGFKF